ncbi:MAG: hypothetical protein IR153_05320 [Flavobacterium sp.]|nr:hypothetical protein [Flavobacterium sp.]
MKDQNNNTRTDETTWNNELKKQGDHTFFNEGFSNEKLPDDYDPAQSKTEDHLKRETETDTDGDKTNVQRARHTDDNSPSGNPVANESADNKVLEDPDLATNRDRNYDVNPNRYPESHPDNDKHRGNIDAGKSE